MKKYKVWRKTRRAHLSEPRVKWYRSINGGRVECSSDGVNWTRSIQGATVRDVFIYSPYQFVLVGNNVRFKNENC